METAQAGMMKKITFRVTCIHSSARRSDSYPSKKNLPSASDITYTFVRSRQLRPNSGAFSLAGTADDTVGEHQWPYKPQLVFFSYHSNRSEMTIRAVVGAAVAAASVQLFLFAPQHANACSCFDVKTLCEYVDSADVVIRATAAQR